MAEFNFTERTPLEHGFAEVFRREIVPVLERYEASRAGYRRKALTGMGAAGAVGVGGVGLGLGLASPGGAFAAAVIGGIGAFGSRAYFESRWKGGMGAAILPVLCNFLGGMRYGAQEIDIAPFERLGVVPSHHRSRLEDPVAGQHKGIGWALTEAVLKRRSRDTKGRRKTRTVFRGLLIRIAIHGPAPRIYFARDRGGALNWLSETFSGSRRGLDKIALDAPEFEATYETYTDDPERARGFIDQRLMSGLMEVAHSEAGKTYIACAMEGDWLYLAIPRRDDFLGLGSLFKPLTGFEEDLHEALDELDLPRRVIERLSGL